jgi:argininosuccinate lyase
VPVGDGLELRAMIDRQRHQRIGLAAARGCPMHVIDRRVLAQRVMRAAMLEEVAELGPGRILRRAQQARHRKGTARVGRIVTYCEAQRKDLRQLTLKEYRMFSELFEEEITHIGVWSSVRSRDVPGGTAPRRVAQSIRRARLILRRREEEN